MNKTKITAWVTAGAIALGSVFGLGVSYSDAIQIALDKDKAKMYCEQLINGEQ